MKTAAAGAILGAVLTVLPGGALAAKPNAAANAITNVAKQLQRQASGKAIAFGTLSGTGTNTVTITTPDNAALTINVIAKPRLVPHSAAAASAGYKTGDQVLVYGTYHNGFTGGTIAYDTTPFPTPLAVRIGGKVSSSSGQSVTLSLANNTTKQIQFGAATHFFVNGKASTTAPTFTASEHVTVLAQEQTDGSLLGRVVAEGALQAAGPALVRVAGKIASVATDNGSFTLTLANGKTATVTISGTTRFRVNGQAATAAPTLTSNEQVAVQGTRSTDASGNVTIAATLINVKTSA